jgi:hypothetical protein
MSLWKHNVGENVYITKDLREMRLGDVELVRLAQNSDVWEALLNTAVDLMDPKGEDILCGWAFPGSWRRIHLYVVNEIINHKFIHTVGPES